ncbi:MAG: Rrf2 family transcriptional regulator [candidate division KSB1 bacterium]|nr:Rrf2 family transcriptional regulator [candidate division KSB1 bacterium]MDZ7274220.1 Rrf2 family transcriptional regulator [candidate division KSB1 bacterium]MDZ7296818.1 Rrf2 family transcriptional regulator [candidate division KSB1 bacterium]MDZ7347684.1 Rrf2 family transcriptional regulator [candidate division KSB1 bacterium]MDZ7351989.1 Rrf2 family transcriptional regulator [candidate division KSB1 bacterium]
MPVLFSRACEYALRALFEMARQEEQESWTVQDLAQRTHTPAPFLAKTFQSLVKGDILTSTKGRSGGFAFARPPAQIRLMDVVDLIDGPALVENCALGLPACGDCNPCPFHDHWKEIRSAIVNTLRSETLASSSLMKKSGTRPGRKPAKTRLALSKSRISP